MEDQTQSRSTYSSSLDDDNSSDIAGYVSYDDTLSSWPMYQSEIEQQEPLLSWSSNDVKHPVQDGFPSQPPGNEQLQHPLKQKKQLFSQLSPEDEDRLRTELEKSHGTIERLRNKSTKCRKRLDETLLVGTGCVLRYTLCF